MKTVNLNAAYFPAVELLSALATAGILLYGGLQAIEGDVTIGVLVAFIAALNNFFDPIQQLSQLYTTYQAGMAALDKIFELLDEEPDLRRPAGRRRARRGCAARSPSTTSTFAYAPDAATPRSTDVDLHVPPGQTVALVGATGAGKSTFAKLVARFYDPTEGRVLRRRPRPARRAGALAALADGDRARRRRSCSAARSATTSPSAGRTRRREEVEAAARAVGARRLHRRARARLRHRDRRARRSSSRPASASSSPSPAR